MPRPAFTYEEEYYIQSARAVRMGVLSRVPQVGYVLPAAALAVYGYTDNRVEIMGLAFLLMLWLWLMDVRGADYWSRISRSIFDKYEAAIQPGSPLAEPVAEPVTS